MKYYFLGLGVLVAVCVGCAGGGSSNVSNMFDKGEYAAPPAAMMMRPGPAVDGPGPGVLNWPVPAPAAPQQRTTQVRFVEPQTMRVGWQVGNRFAENQIVVPGRYNFIQGNTYRLKLTGMPNREGETLYPTLQVYPGQPQTDAYLTHNSIPIELTIDDLDQVAAGNFVTKVIYLPDPKFQDLAIGDVETLVSTRLAPGVDPVVEADKRGTIMAVLRVGNFDYEMPTAFGTPQAPGPQGMPAPGNSGPGPDAPGPMLSNPNGGNLTTMNYDGEVQQVQYQNQQAGSAPQFVPPTPVDTMNPGSGGFGVPGATIVGGPRVPPGLPPMHPIAGMGPVQPWGLPYTGTPIGLPGPAHLPLGGNATLRSHTVINNSKNEIPDGVKDFSVVVKHEPGFRLPPPVSSVEYTEKHPMYQNGETSWPKWTGR